MSEDQIDLTKIAIGVATHFIEGAASHASDVVSALSSKVKIQMRQGFADYVRSNLVRTSRIKTILTADEVIPLENIYTPLTYVSGDAMISDADVMEEFERSGKCLVVGTAGGGKTIFLKKLYNELAKSRAAGLPIFFELRSLNQASGASLFEVLYTSVRTQVSALSRESFDSYTRSGKFPLILDGFDEINFDSREAYTKEIVEFSRLYPDAKVIISTRPEEDLSVLSEFKVFRVQPMSKEQAISLLQKISYDPDVKVPFIEAVRSHLYQQHQGFASNPLLISMMLLTYGSYSDIPDKIYIFYQQAFEVLFQRHDRSKGTFTRKAHAGLAIDEFQRIFAYFCASSYADEEFSFGDSSVIERLRSSIAFVGAVCSPEALLNDLVRSTCLLHRDGTNYTFVHRSFQEYFTSVFISRLPDDDVKEATDSILSRSISDGVIAMLYAIDPDKFERSWALPTCEYLCSILGGGASPLEPKAILSRLFNNWGVRDKRVTYYLEPTKLDGYRLYLLTTRYGETFESVRDRGGQDFWKSLQALVRSEPEEACRDRLDWCQGFKRKIPKAA